ncbi:DUF4268 domain-containing protein [Hymenobacter sp. 5414T-23]|uniref:DUF4268 domain-containing protein n=1 Tax=Hymenobacter sp. 5414T-23 TaxID=2932252 RepID=UPI001FD50949|nr:DUF4268 domain-containing protein [Hymenobacter sp. 5414T-23]UOQ80993.1 DUF4268 domain-containing protein [Hymenobacter sp. 5414T-23]
MLPTVTRPQLGVFKSVPLRTIWPHEALDFTQWLGRDENMALLCEELDITVENIRMEVASGRYNVDIVAELSPSRKVVIIENQLESTDHKHLGQLLTYASGHDASVIIWNVSDYTEEHRQAIDWFNQHMPEGISFFLVKVELWQIGDSLPAPKFNIICQPNNWAKTVSRVITEGGTGPSDLKLLQQRFWNEFKDWTQHHRPQSQLRLGRTPRPQHWYEISIGTSKAIISLTSNSREQRIGCELYIHRDVALYQRLEANKAAIDQALGDQPEWQDLPDSTAFRIVKYHACSPLDEAQWNAYFAWLHDQAEIFHRTFRSHF